MTTDSAPAESQAEPEGAWPDYPTLLRKPLTERQIKLLERARMHAADFATRADQHDRENSFPVENYDAMRASGYAHMTLPSRLGPSRPTPHGSGQQSEL